VFVVDAQTSPLPLRPPRKKNHTTLESIHNIKPCAKDARWSQFAHVFRAISREESACSQQTTRDSRYQTADSRYQTADSRQQTAHTA
jgi:hypothetical protein